MKKVLFLLVLSLVCLNLSAERIVISIPYESKEQLQDYIEQGYDIAHVSPGKEIHLVIHEDAKSNFMKKYAKGRVIFTESEMKNNLSTSHERLSGYQSYNQMIQRLESLVNTYPDLCQIIELGASQGKLYLDAGNNNYTEYNNVIYGIKLSKNVTINEDEPNYYFFGNIHAREPITAEICMRIINHLVESYDKNNSEHPLNQSQVWIIPVTNPDGRDIVYTQRDVLHRKTIFDNNGNGRFDAPQSGNQSIDGIDANRNFSFKWGTTGVTWGFDTQTYPGNSPFSAIEAAYIRDLAADIPFIAGISYHSYGNLVLWPYGYDWNSVSHNYQTISSLAYELAGLIRRYNQNYLFYEAFPSYDLYPASGDSEDYLHHYHNILAFNIETADSFIPPATAVPQITQDHIPAAMHLLSRHKNKFLTGIVTDKITGEVLKAEIKVFPNDSGNPNRQPIYSSEEFGRYHYTLMPGNYQLSVTKENYTSFFTNFVITAVGQTVVNVMLVPNIEPNCPILEKPENNALNVSVKPTFEWSVDPAGNEATSYNLQVSETMDFATLLIDEPELENTSFIVPEGNELSKNETYYWRVIAKNNHGECFGEHNIWSFTTIPFLPAKVILTSPINNATEQLIRPTLNWQKPEGVTDGFYVYIGKTVNPTLVETNFIAMVDTTTFVCDFNLEYETTYHWQIIAYNGAGEGEASDSWSFVTQDDVSIEDTLLPTPSIILYPNYPNPFNPTTTLQFGINPSHSFGEGAHHVRIEIFNVRGQKVRTLVNGGYPTGEHSVVWDGTYDNGATASSGIYLYRMTVGGFSETQKMLLIK